MQALFSCKVAKETRMTDRSCADHESNVVMEALRRDKPFRAAWANHRDRSMTNIAEKRGCFRF